MRDVKLNKTVTPEMRKKIKDYYMDNNSVMSTSAKFRVPMKIVKGIVRLQRNQVDDLYRRFIIELYQRGYNSSELSRKTAIKQGTITSWLRDAGVTRHRGPKSKVGNELFFRSIDSEHKAYFLGWLMADGNVSIYNGQYSIKVAVQEQDRDVIDKFLTAIDADYTPHLRFDNKGHGSYYISVTSKEMCCDLMSLGVVPCKSGHESFPDIPKELEHHFIRGYFDGDGITCTAKSKRSGFIAPTAMLESIQERIGSSLKMSRSHCSIDMRTILGGIKFSRSLYRYMYSDATVWMYRKRQRMDIICGNTEITSESKESLAS